jgi:hypothetical protein
MCFGQVGWLNAFMSQAWPGLNEAASKTAKDSLDAMLKQYQPDAIETLKVNKIHLGEEPPFFRGTPIPTYLFVCSAHAFGLHLWRNKSNHRGVGSKTTAKMGSR